MGNCLNFTFIRHLFYSGLVGITILQATDSAKSADSETDRFDLREQGQDGRKEPEYSETTDFLVAGTPELQYTLCYRPEEARPLQEAGLSIPQSLRKKYYIKEEPGGAELVKDRPEAPQQSSGSVKETRLKVEDPSLWPHRVHGHLQMTFKTGRGAKQVLVGSGILVGPNHVLTAGHNLYNRNYINPPQWATKVFFTPGRAPGIERNSFPFGCSKGSILLCPKKWVKRSPDDNYDFGMVILDRPLGNNAGWSGLIYAPDLFFNQWRITVTGYPGNQGSADYYSASMWEKEADVKEGWFDKEVIRYEILTSEGQSGGAIWRKWLTPSQPDQEIILTTGIHTNVSKRPNMNQGVRLTKEKFELIVNWIRAYYLKESKLFTLPPPPQLKQLKAGDDKRNRTASDWWLQGKTPGLSDEQVFICFYNAILCCAKVDDISEEMILDLAECYWKGKGTQKDYLKAFYLYMQSDPTKSALPLYRIGMCYWEGRGGIPPDEDAGLDFLKRAAESEVRKAISKLFYYYSSSSENYPSGGRNANKANRYQEQAQRLGIELPKPKGLLSKNSRPWQKVIATVPSHNLPDRLSNFQESFPEGSKKSYLTLLWEQLHEAAQTAVVCAPVVGMGGIGKSTLTLKYAYEALDNKAYKHIYWILSDTLRSLIEEYKTICGEGKLEIHLRTDDTDGQIIDSIKKKLEKEGSYLLIYDNAPNPSFLRNKIPQTGGHIVITSRYSKEWKDKMIFLDVFRPEEASDYILTRLQLEPTEDSREKALELAHELDYLPLALSHAAGCIAYLQDSGYTIENYLQEFRKQPIYILEDEEHRNPDDLDPDVSYKHLVAERWDLVAKTWTISGRRISPLAHDLMVYFSYLGSEFIGVDIFLKSAQSEINLKYSLSQLAAFSLIKLNNQFASLHRLVQYVIRAEQEVARDEQEAPQHIKKTGQQRIEEICNLFLGKATDLFKTNFDDWESREDALKYFSHIVAVLGHAKRLNLRSQSIDSLEWVGKILLFSGYDMTTSASLTLGSKDGGISARLKQVLEQGKMLFGSGEKEGNLEALMDVLDIAKNGHSSVLDTIGSFYRCGYWVPLNYKKAIEWYTRAIDQGNANAQNNLGYMYQHGQGVTQDFGTAKELFTLAANQGNSVARNNLGFMYGQGQGMTQDFDKAKELLTLAADQGNANAQNNLGYMYRRGQGVEQDFGKAFFWYAKAAQQGLAAAQINLGVMYHLGLEIEQDFDQALFWYSKAAEQGLAIVQNNLGTLYLYAEGVARDYAKAFFWYSKAAEQGEATAQYNLGFMYRYGKYVEQDFAKALSWFNQAAAQNQPHALYHIGFIYQRNLVPTTRKEAPHFFKKAAEQFMAEPYQQGSAQNLLGDMYHYGRGVEKDLTKAIEYYQKAAAQNYPLAQATLGRVYKEGWGTKQDLEKALLWIKKAADQEDNEGQYNLALMYRDGEGVPLDDQEAVRLFRLAGEQYNADAHYNLGWMYEQGRGVKKDLSQAQYWYQKGEKGHAEDAFYSLGRMYEYGLGTEKNFAKAIRYYGKSAKVYNENARDRLEQLGK
ncbi:SEL1-like repeat protein [Candidatus Odyssella acanthamoebae]|uniref:SEL1-like repeat protein n=1 Tax=Candidatus Odyssella acanthamoebae TaxID=91604 RepID=UPI00094B063D|nr:SEL1-like repeat protein [Candidatus Paracaedibacter acanthamoebae]